MVPYARKLIATLALLLAVGTGAPLAAAQIPEEGATDLDAVVVSATRRERASKSVPTAVASMGAEQLEKRRMNSISDALQDIPGVLTYSRNGLSSTKLIIRGAGLKARYGLREVMVLRDGIPLTEPDSFTRLDTIDGQDIERLEVTKGPGNLYASGSAGGTVHVITKSVFDQDRGRMKLGLNDDGGKDAHLRVGRELGESQAFSLTVSHREFPNRWRMRNDQSSDHVSFKHGLWFGDDNLLETEIGYAGIDMQLQREMNEAQWQDFKRSGEQTGVDSPFKHTGRYSKNFFFNTKAEIDTGGYTLTPKLYYSQYHHVHPVTGFINDNSDHPPSMIGADVAVEKDHRLAGLDAQAVFGIAGRINEARDAKKYTYADVATPGGRITSTLSDRKGDLAKITSTRGTLLGVFGSEHIKMSDRLSLDITARVDDVKLTIDEDERIAYDYSAGNYGAGAGVSHYEHNMTLNSASIGASYAITPEINAFVSIARGDQIPADSELNDNPDLNKASNRNVEIGLKGRGRHWYFDTSLYRIEGTDEVIQLRQPNNESQYVNAGKTTKQGFEFSGGYEPSERWTLGGAFGWNDYTYKEFQEEVRSGGSVSNIDRGGNRLPLIPRHQANAFVEYTHPNGFSAQLKVRRDGAYYLDNANSEKWEDNKTLADLNLRYRKDRHQLDFTVNNLTDARHALEVSKDTGGDKSYVAGAPRSFLVNYSYRF
uniref:Iron complex outermembrane recepter protein n=1 Tax=Candidatus Kentrum sp. DK TaxID=2126562 RepID=A0A450SR42_9GAMM|nr:MAG: iron complex outermembrane recepter protein [Candidatus Kentron sp. DK]